MKSLFLIIFASFTLSAFASDVNELCLKAKLGDVQFLDLETWENTNICEKKLEDLTVDEKRNLE